MNSAFLKSYECLSAVFRDGAFSSIALNNTLSEVRQSDRSLITKIVYGVLDENIRLEYIIGKFVKKAPKGDVLIFLKMGAYILSELSIPVYAAVDGIAELTKLTGDKRAVGFVNATLKNMAPVLKKGFDAYPDDKIQYLSVRYSYPEWAVRKLIKDYGADTAAKIISFRLPSAASIRVNGVTKEEILSVFPSAKAAPFEDAFYADFKGGFDDGRFTVQSVASMAVARAAAANAGAKFLDCCSAPGGKAVYVKQLSPETQITACDVHPHRTELIRKYAQRMNAELDIYCQDMTVFRSEWAEKFDTVLCDVPCSGFGVLDSRPDIKLFRKNEDISSLMKLQRAILGNCSRYVAKGGRLIYSTCTVFDNENGQNIRRFLAEHAEFSYDEISLPQFPNACGKPYYQFLPHEDGVQGFYIACLKRV